MKELEAEGIVTPQRGRRDPGARGVRPHREGRGARAGGARAQGVGALLALSDPRRDRAPLAYAVSQPTRRSRMADEPKTAEDVKSLVKDRDIRFIRLWFTDILGQLKSFSINAAELEDAFEGGMGFDGSSITGFNAIEESDMIAMPDPSTFKVLPWRPEDRGVARMFCDVRHPEPRALRGRPAPGAAADARARRGARLHELLRGPGARVLLLPQRQARGRRARGPRRGRVLRPDHARRRLRRAPRDGAGARAARHPRGVHPPRGRARRSTRSTCATPTRSRWPTTA